MRGWGIVTLLLATLCTPLAAQEADYAVIPLPQTITYDEGDAFLLDSTCVIVADGTLAREAAFLHDYLLAVTAIDVPIVERPAPKRRTITLACEDALCPDEGYTLTVAAQHVTLRGATAAGVFYGIQTLRKALPVGAYTTVALPAATIHDAPRYAYRGVMLDCARHFFPVAFIEEFLDLLALHNINRFHWHLTDDQGWRIEIKKYPLLTTVGSSRAATTIGHNSLIDDATPYGGYYTQDEARHIVDYARQRHIEVIPEIDMPGHQTAALAAYPMLGCTGGPYAVGINWGIYLNILCLGSEQTYTFCEDVLREIIDIFPSEYIHIGGDEAPTDIIAHCPRCQALMAAQGRTAATLQGYFTARIAAFLAAQGRTAIGWDEILDDALPAATIIHCWRGVARAEQAASANYDVILSQTDYCYLDYYQADPILYDEPPAIGGLLTVEQVYALGDALATLTPATEDHLLGIQGNLWTEYISSPPHVEYMLLPRIAALADVQWAQSREPFAAFAARLPRLTALYNCYHLPYGRHLWREEIPPRDRDYY